MFFNYFLVTLQFLTFEPMHIQLQCNFILYALHFFQKKYDYASSDFFSLTKELMHTQEEINQPN